MSIGAIIVDKLIERRNIKMTTLQRREIAGRYLNRYFLLEIGYNMKMKRRRTEIYRAHCESDAELIIRDLTAIGVSVYFHNNVYTLSW